MEGKRVLVFGEILVDSLENKRWHPGGAPFNVACHLKGMGGSPLFVSALGKDDIADFLMEKVDSWGLDKRAIKRNDKASGMVEVEVNNGEPSYNILNDRSYDHIESPDSGLIEECKLLYYGSLALRNSDSHKTLIKIKREFKGVTFVDINIREPWFSLEKFSDLLYNVEWLKINHHEVDIVIPEKKGLKDKVIELSQKYNINNIVCTQGERGAFIYSGRDSGFYNCGIVEAENFKNTMGAGDGFSASVINSLLNSDDYQTILKKASEFSSSICSLSGAIPDSLDFYN